MKKKDYELSFIIGIIIYILFILPNINSFDNLIGSVIDPGIDYGLEPQQPPQQSIFSTKLAQLGLSTDIDNSVQPSIWKNNARLKLVGLTESQKQQLKNFADVQPNDIMFSSKGVFINSNKIEMLQNVRSKLTFDLEKPANTYVQILRFNDLSKYFYYIFTGIGGSLCSPNICSNLQESNGKISFDVNSLSGYAVNFTTISTVAACPVSGTGECLEDNIPPYVKTVNMLPQYPTTSDTLRCLVNIVDNLFISLDTLITNVTITNSTAIVNSSIIAVTNGTNITVNYYVPHKKGEVWMCLTKPFDGSNYGPTAFSNPVTVVNVPPAQGSPSFTTINTSSTYDDLICETQNLNDIDNDPITSIYTYLVNNIPLNALYLPMEANSSNATRDYSGDNQIVQSFNGAHAVAADTGKAFRFDGVNDYLRVLDHEDLEYDGNESFTIESWIKTSGSNKQVILAKKAASGIGPYYILYTENGKIFFELSNGTLTKILNNSASIYPVNDGVFHHVAVRANRYANNFRIYADGFPSLTTSLGINGSIGINSAPLTIGGLLSGTTLLFPCNCDIDETLFYNYPLAIDQIVLHSSGIYNIVAKNDTFQGEQWKCRTFVTDGESDGQQGDSTVYTIGYGTGTPPPGPGPSGGPPGGPSIGGSTSGGNTILNYIDYVFDLRIDTTKTFNIRRQDRILIEGLQRTYRLSISRIYSLYVDIFIHPNVGTLRGGGGRILRADLDRDGNIDITLDISVGSANQVRVTINKNVQSQLQANQSLPGIQQILQNQSTQKLPTTQQPAKSVVEKLKEKKNLLFYGIIIVILAVFFIMWTRIILKKN